MHNPSALQTLGQQPASEIRHTAFHIPVNSLFIFTHSTHHRPEMYNMEKSMTFTTKKPSPE